MREVIDGAAAPRAVFLGLVITLCPGTLVAQAPFSVEDVLSYSFASGLMASESTDRIAWIENREGRRNVWVAEGPSWEGRALTSYEADDGQELSGVAFTPDAASVLYVRGGAPNRRGEIPDPLYTPQEEGRAVWIVPFTGGEAREVVEGGSFVVAPDGERIAYASGNEIFTVELTADAEPSRVARIRGSAGSLTWSPDGTRLAFVSGRGDHAFIGVLDAAAEEVTYLDPGLADDGSPVWSPEGDRIAFLRVPNERVVHLFAPRREALPFSIRVADVESGEAREVWSADPEPGASSAV